MFLETARLWLERPAEGDAAGFMGPRRDEPVQRFLGGVVTAWVARDRFGWVLSYLEGHDYGMCLIREQTKGRPTGLRGLDQLEGEVQLAYKLLACILGQGLCYRGRGCGPVLRF